MNAARIRWSVVVGVFLVAVPQGAPGAVDPKRKSGGPASECPPCEWHFLRDLPAEARRTVVVKKFSQGKWGKASVRLKFLKAADAGTSVSITGPKGFGVYRMSVKGSPPVHFDLECPRPIVPPVLPGPLPCADRLVQGEYGPLEPIEFDLLEQPGTGPVEMTLERFDGDRWKAHSPAAALESGTPGKASLKAPSSPGIYRLTVKQGDASARSVFEVKKRP